MKEIILEGKTIPAMLYGTAWKKQDTRILTEAAIKAGFRAIDTANQRLHYNESGVGDAIQSMIQKGRVKREDLFLQTKYTYQRGQGGYLPYDPKASYADQVKQSLENSLGHLRESYVDSFILHGPDTVLDLNDADWEVWEAMSDLHKSGQVKYLGVSNFNYNQLCLLVEKAEVKPRFIQNRCFSSRMWDKEIREFCQEQGIIYQGFSLLTANKRVLGGPEIQTIMLDHDKTLGQVIFRFARQLGMMVLTGTSDPIHMREDLSIDDFELSDRELNIIENIAG